LVCGVLLSFALPSTNLWPLAGSLTVVFYLVATSRSVRGAFGYGALTALGCFAPLLLWLPTSFTDLFGPVSWLIYPPILAVLALFWGIVTGLARHFGGRGVRTLWLLPALWVLMEWARAQGPFAFTWGTLGYIWVDTPPAQLADLAGVYGLSLWTATVAALLAAPFVTTAETWRARVLPVVGALALSAGAWAYGAYRLAAPPATATDRALLVQGATDPLGRAQGTAEGEVARYQRLTTQALRRAEARPQLVIWPEGATLELTYLQGDEQQRAWRAIQQTAPRATFIVGGAAVERGRAYNSAFSLSGGRVRGRYDKVYLVPYGESVPFSDALAPLYATVYRWFGFEDFMGRSPGRQLVPLPTPLGAVATYMCYESIFPQVARTMVARGAGVLVNISNDAWFGRGDGARQHFEMGRLRAIETRRYLLRVGNDGITALIDPSGQVVAELPRGGQRTLMAAFAPRRGLTPYVRFGDALVVILTLYAVLISVSSGTLSRGRRVNHPN